MLIPDTARGKTGQQLPPILRRAERALQSLPRAEDALAVAILSIVAVAGFGTMADVGPGIGVGTGPSIGARGARAGSAGNGSGRTGVGGTRGRRRAGRTVVFRVLV
jgi:hypothetical protein